MTVERSSGEAELDDASDLCSPAMTAGGSGSLVGWLRSERLELAATIVLSFAVVLTAWSAFESGKWSGVQAIKFSEAGAARIESARLDTLAGQLTQLDIAVFSDWSAAVSESHHESRCPSHTVRDGWLPERGCRRSGAAPWPG